MVEVISQPITRGEWQEDRSRINGITSEPLSNIIAPVGIVEMADFSLITACEALEGIAAFHADQGNEHAISVVSLFEALSDVESSMIRESADPKTLILGHTAVQNFLDGRMLADEQKEIISRWNDIATEVQSYIISGISSGYIPKFVEQRLHDALYTTGVRIVDSELASHLGVVGFYENEHDFYGVKADSLNDPDFIDTVLHEVLHKLSGGTFWRRGESNQPHRRRVGFGYELADGSMLRIGHNEAWNQHVTAGCKNGDFETIDPDKRDNDDRTYYAERKILAKLIEGAEGLIDVKNAINAFFADGASEGGKDSMRRYIQQGNSAYGRGWLKKMSRLMEAASWMPISQVTEYVHGPVLDNDGNIIQPGTVDIETIPSFDEYFSKMFREMRVNASSARP